MICGWVRGRGRLAHGGTLTYLPLPVVVGDKEAQFVTSFRLCFTNKGTVRCAGGGGGAEVLRGRLRDKKGPQEGLLKHNFCYGLGLLGQTVTESRTQSSDGHCGPLL